MRRTLFPWNDRAGRLSPLKLTVFSAALVPLLWLVLQAGNDWLGSKPLTEAIHQTGDWAVRFLLLSLLVTPLRYIAYWPQLISVRRILGLTALAYTALHLVLYVALQGYDIQKVISEIILRIYLTIGFVALLGLVVLGATSTDGMVRRLGALRWNQLHKAVYAITTLALVHFALQSKIDVTQAALMAGLFLWLMGFRLLRRYNITLGVPSLSGLALTAGVLTALTEAGWYGTMTGVSGMRVLWANLDFEYVIRPAWWVLLAGLAMLAIGVVRARASSTRGRQARTLAPSAASTEQLV
jgi:methionine sulfoxide reductase heme-binding subunit